MFLRVLFVCLFLGSTLAQVNQATQAGCFEGTVTIRNPSITPGDPNYPISSHRGYIWYVTPQLGVVYDTAAANSTEEFQGEAIMRLEIYFGNPVAYTEVMIRRMHNLVEGPTDTSFTDGFLKHGEKYETGCCLHSTVDKEKQLNYINTSDSGEYFYIPRSDGWTEVQLDDITVYNAIGGNAYCTPGPTTDLLNAIFYRDFDTSYANWGTVVTDCPLKCQVQANFVFVLDGSGSISGPSWTNLINFLNAFISQVQISSDATHVGIVMYTGSDDDNDPDLNCVVKPSDAGVNGYSTTYDGDLSQFDNDFFRNLWSTAIVDDEWYNQINWKDWRNGATTSASNFGRTVCFPAPFNTNRGGVAWVALYLSDVQSVVSDFVSTELIVRVNQGFTATGTGIALGLELFDRAAVERPAVPEKMIVITDGQANRGQFDDQTQNNDNTNQYNPLYLRGISNLARLAGIEVYAVGVGSGIGVNQLNLIGTGCRSSDRSSCFPGYTWGDGNYSRTFAGEDDPHVFIAPSYSVTSLQPFLNQLLDVECIDASASGTLCSADCGDNFCTACGSCIQCTVHNECPQYPCQFCTSALTCQLTSTTRVCAEFFDGTPSSCESYSCSRARVPDENLDEAICANKTVNADGVSYEDECRDRDIRLACGLDLDQVKVDNARSVCRRQDKTFVLEDFNGDVVCTCQSETEHDTDSAALIAGTTAGGAFLLCLGCLLPCLLLLCLLAIIIIIVLLVLLILIIIFLLVLLFGIRLAIPPKIRGIAVDNPTNVIAQENPLAQESGWQDAPQLE